MLLRPVVASLLLSFTLSGPAFAACEHFNLTGDAEPKFEAGRLVSVSATGVSEVRGDKPTDLVLAMRTASLKARGALTRYLAQDVLAEQKLDTISSSERANEQGVGSSKNSETEHTSETIRSSARDLLTGATLVSECFDSEQRLLFVKVGINEGLIASLKSFGTEHSAAMPSSVSKSSPPLRSFDRRSRNAGLFE